MIIFLIQEMLFEASQAVEPSQEDQESQRSAVPDPFAEAVAIKMQMGTQEHLGGVRGLGVGA